VKWFKLAEVQSMMDQQFTAEEHSPQLSLLMKKYDTK
jgi:hypothetical protein